VLLVSKGEFGRALAYGIVLLAMVFIVALVLTSVQNLARKRV
jgi:ABC-type tungstate transport system substrate-binding protein